MHAKGLSQGPTLVFGQGLKLLCESVTGKTADWVDFVNKDACFHARVFVHYSSGFFRIGGENAETADIAVIADWAYNAKLSIPSKLEVPPPVFPNNPVRARLTSLRSLVENHYSVWSSGPQHLLHEFISDTTHRTSLPPR